jgi:hypothetical protein
MTWHYPAATAYCGPPPTPDSVTWNLDPILIGGLLARIIHRTCGTGYRQAPNYAEIPLG